MGRPFIERWKEHLYDFRVNRPYLVTDHFNEYDNHQEVMFHAKILSLLKESADHAAAWHKHKENWWIHTF